MRGFWSNICFYGRCIGIVCREWWRKVFVLAACAWMCGCVNLYTRFPTTNPEIEECYQSTRVMAAMTVIGSFPQMMSDVPSKSGSLCWENLISVTFIGLPCFVDTCLEAAVDTVCLPADYFMARAREKKD